MKSQPHQEGAPKEPRRNHQPKWRLIALVLAGLGLSLIIAFAAALAALDTRAGHAFLTRQLANYHFASGLNLRVGQIDGSLFGRATFRNVEARDQDGVFARAPEVVVDWRPAALIRKRLELRSLTAAAVDVLRKPNLKPVPRDPNKPLIPDIDLTLSEVRVDRIDIAATVAGRRQLASLAGGVRLDHGGAQLILAGEALPFDHQGGGDRLRAHLDIVPQSNRFELSGTLLAPASGLLVGILGLDETLDADIEGSGNWAQWQGQAKASLGGNSLGSLSLTARNGNFALKGTLRPAPVLSGVARDLLAPATEVRAQVIVKDRKVSGNAEISSPALKITLQGGLDLGKNRYDALKLTASLLRPAALAPQLAATDASLDMRLDGQMARPDVEYSLSAASISFSDLTLEALTVSGRSRIDIQRLRFPVRATASRLVGLGANFGGPLTRLRLDGDIAYSAGRFLSDNLHLRSDRIDATAVVVADIGKGQYFGALKGRVNSYDLKGVGSFDLTTDARIRASRQGFGLEGSIKVISHRLDNAVLSKVLKGQGELAANLILQPDGSIELTGLRLTSPGLTVSQGEGVLRSGGEMRFHAAGASPTFGPLDVTIGGTLAEPEVHLVAQSPQLAVPLKNVVFDIHGEDAHYQVKLRGGSPWGEFQGSARVNPQPLTIDIETFDLAGIRFNGKLSATNAGPFSGAIQISGSGLRGTANLSAEGSIQKVDLGLTAVNARIPTTPAVTIASGRLTATTRLPASGPQIVADATVAGLKRGDISISAGRVKATYATNHADAQLVVRGSSGVPFDIAGQGTLDQGHVRANIQGTLDGQTFRLTQPAHIEREGATWRLKPATVNFPAGAITVSGVYGKNSSLSLDLRDLDLEMAQTIAPDLAVEGRVSGRIDAALAEGEQFPKLNFRIDISRFSKLGLATASPAVDLALQGDWARTGGKLNAAIRRGGETIGQVQARLGTLGTSGSFSTRVQASSLSGGVRYSGPSNVLWAFAGLAGQQLTGPVAVAADLGGRLGQPSLTGTVRADSLRYENSAYGTIISDLAVRGTFTQSRLEVSSLTGRAGSGSIRASGWIGLDAANGFPMHLNIGLQNARLAGGDSLSASVSGSLEITHANGQSPLIKGDLSIPEARYQFVRSDASEVPVLDGVRRLGSASPSPDPDQDGKAMTPGLPGEWRLDIRLTAPDRIFVSGLGLDAEWNADLHVGGTSAQPEITGVMRVVRGDYSFAGRRLALDHAEIRFDGGAPSNPILNISASTTVEGVTATLGVSGRAQAPQINLTSLPALPQDEVLSRLLFGASIAELSPAQAVQLAGSLRGLISGGTGGANALSRLRSATGLARLRILGADQATGRGTAVSTGTYLGRNIYIELVTDARGFTATQLEIALSRTLSLLVQAGTLNGQSVELQYSRDY